MTKSSHLSAQVQSRNTYLHNFNVWTIYPLPKVRGEHKAKYCSYIMFYYTFILIEYAAWQPSENKTILTFWPYTGVDGV